MEHRKVWQGDFTLINLDVETINGQVKEIVYNVNDFPYENFKTSKKVKNKKGISYYNIPCAFDIESTTLEPKKENDKYIETPIAFMYHWQACINDSVIFGRTWEEFEQFIDNLTRTLELNDYKRLVIYVHNLAYEFQFMHQFINISTIFSKAKRKPMKIITNNGVEFRCSYFLSNMSLMKFCENSKGVTHYKLEDKFDYRKVRTPSTELTSIEKSYCYNDVRGLCECISYLLEEDTIISIPLTNTGYVRREYRKAMNTPHNRKVFEKIQLNERQYIMLKRAFRGGNTHANRFYSNVILKKCYSYDLQSSYPACMLLDYYPMGKFTECTIDTQDKLDYFTKEYCCLFDITFKDIHLKLEQVIPYIDIAHCYEKCGIINDNGRVLKADYIAITLTEIDLDIIRRTYDYESFIITKAYFCNRGKLPNEMRETLLDFYQTKTDLKAIESKEYEYAKSKNKVNSSFGMCVQHIDNSDIQFNDSTFEWTEEVPEIQESLDRYYKSRNSFLSYQWGVWITCHARRRLQEMLDKVGQDVIYIDTDSIKFQGIEHCKEFDDLNKTIIKSCEDNDIKAYADRKNEDGTTTRFYLGIWDCETPKGKEYKKFKTLGAKKYAYVQADKQGNDTFHITVSGMHKKKGAKAIADYDKQKDPIENFNIGYTFKDVGRTTSWYNDVEKYTIKVNGEEFTNASNIAICESTYTLGVTNEYWELICNNITDSEVLAFD